MNLRNPPPEWASVCAALCLLLLALSLPQTFRGPSSARATSAKPPPRPGTFKPLPDTVEPGTRPHANAPRPHAPAPRLRVNEDPWDFNYALQSNGTTATGGSRPELLIDANATVYDGSAGYAYTNWPTRPPPHFIITFKQGVRLNAVRFLLWDQDSRFYRYKLEASPALARDEWVLLADRTGETNECRSWQVVTFKTQLACRLRLTGTYNSANEGFHVVELEAYRIPTGQACPWLPPDF